MGNLLEASGTVGRYARVLVIQHQSHLRVKNTAPVISILSLCQMFLFFEIYLSPSENLVIFSSSFFYITLYIVFYSCHPIENTLWGNVWLSVSGFNMLKFWMYVAGHFLSPNVYGLINCASNTESTQHNITLHKTIVSTFPLFDV